LGGAEPRPVWVVDLGGAQVPPPTPGASPSRVDHKSFHFLEVVDNERRCKQLPTHAAKKVHVLTSFALLCEQGSSVTLIFYALDKRWWSTGSEPFLNLVAAAAQFSKFTHVELAIGEDSGARGEMINVLRIFNDDTGVELTQRTGKNPNYSYLQLGCSKKSVEAMLRFAKSQVGKPFSSSGMARSLIWPRNSDGTSWFCAELVAAALKVGGLLSTDSRTGEATPKSLHSIYKSQGAASGNPCVVRQSFHLPRTAHAHFAPNSSVQLDMKSLTAPSRGIAGATCSWRRTDSPPRTAFRVISAGQRTHSSAATNGVTISLSRLTDSSRNFN